MKFKAYVAAATLVVSGALMGSVMAETPAQKSDQAWNAAHMNPAEKTDKAWNAAHMDKKEQADKAWNAEHSKSN